MTETLPMSPDFIIVSLRVHKERACDNCGDPLLNKRAMLAGIGATVRDMGERPYVICGACAAEWLTMHPEV